MFKQFRDESKIHYGRETDSGNLSNDDLKVGCLQRIADATELMAKNYAQLQRERDNYERWYKDACAESERLGRSCNALRGYIKRLKTKIAA